MSHKYFKEIIYLRVPVHIEYDGPKSRAHVLEAILNYDKPYINVLGVGKPGWWAYETKLKPKLMRKPK